MTAAPTGICTGCGHGVLLVCHAFVHGALFIRKGMVMFPTHNPVDYVRAFGIAFAAGMATGMSVK